MLRDVEKAISEVLREKYSQTVYDLWFSELHLVELTDTRAVFSIPSDFKRGILQTRHAQAIEDALLTVNGFSVPVEIISTAGQIADEQEKGEEIGVSTESKLIPTSRNYSIDGKTIVSEYTFDNFIVGESNKFAHAACLAVASSPNIYNPLFIHGPSGLGKTHLLYAITNMIKVNHPEMRLIYKKGEEFTNELIESIQKGTTLAFREKYRSADLLLIDDIQFIAGKESTQEEFFHTFTALYEAEKQIILTSDRPPRDIKTLEDRLRSRFEWGLVADIQPPSVELRQAIISKKAEERGISLSPQIISYLAQNLQTNIRQLEGSIKKIAAISVLTGTPVSLDMSKRAISDILSGEEPVSITVDKICAAVSKKYGVSTDDIKGKKRNQNIVFCRHVCVYLIREITSLPLTSIGEIMGRDHATVSSSINKVNEERKKNKAFSDELDLLMVQLKK